MIDLHGRVVAGQGVLTTDVLLRRLEEPVQRLDLVLVERHRVQFLLVFNVMTVELVLVISATGALHIRKFVRAHHVLVPERPCRMRFRLRMQSLSGVLG